MNEYQEDTLPKIEVMQAFVDGKEIEYEAGKGRWQPASTPAWHWGDTDYRVKPVQHTQWVNMYGCATGLNYPTKALADHNEGVGRTACVELTWKDGEGLS